MMKLYKKEIQPLGLYDTEEFTAERLIPGFENWYPEEQKEELRELIFERHSETFKNESLALIFDERFVEVEDCNEIIYSAVMKHYKKMKETGELLETKTGKWLSVGGNNIMSLVPVYKCSICYNTFSGYYPPDVCEHCGAKMVMGD